MTREYRAREAFGDEKAFWWRRAVDAYPDYADYDCKTDRQIPVFVLEPVSGGTPAGHGTEESEEDAIGFPSAMRPPQSRARSRS